MFYRVKPGSWLVERQHVGMTWTKGHSRGYPLWVHFLVHGQKVLARGGDWSKEQMNKVEQSGEATFMPCLSTWNTKDSSTPKTSRLATCCPSKCKWKSCFGWSACSPTTSGKKWIKNLKGCPNAMSQASHNTLARIDGGIKWWCGYMRQEKRLSSLPPNIPPQVIGKWEGWWHWLCS